MPSLEPSSRPSTRPFPQPSSGSPYLLSDVHPSDVEFLDLLKRDDRGPSVFKVKIGEKLCIMKVVRTNCIFFGPEYDE